MKGSRVVKKEAPPTKELDPAFTKNDYQLEKHYSNLFNKTTAKLFAKDVVYHILKNSALLRCCALKELVPKIKSRVNRNTVLKVAMKHCLDSCLYRSNRTIEDKIECIQYLISQGVNSEKFNYDSIMMYTLRTHDLQLLRAMLEAKICKVNSGIPYLLYAIEEVPNAVDILLEYGADPNIVSTHHYTAGTPLMYAVSWVNNRCWWRNQHRRRPTHTATDTATDTATYQYTQFPFSIIQKLLNAGANVNSVDNLGNIPLTIINYSSYGPPSPFNLTMERVRYKVNKLLLENGSNVNYKTVQYKDTALHLAASGADIKSMQLLLEFGADVNKIDKEGDTVSHRLVKSKYRFSQYSWTWDDESDYEGEHLPDITKFQDIIIMLMQYGTDINVKDRAGLTLVQCCYQRKLWDYVKILLYMNCSLEGFRSGKMRVGDTAYYCYKCESGSHVVNESPDRQHQVAEILSEFGIKSLNCENINYTSYPSLKMLCRKIIREKLGTTIHNKLPLLQLPQFINNFILLKHFYQ